MLKLCSARLMKTYCKLGLRKSKQESRSPSLQSAVLLEVLVRQELGQSPSFTSELCGGLSHRQ
jgi:hypothetical protein